MNHFKIVSNFTAAVETASEILGHPMYECYENVMADEVRRHNEYGTDKFYVSDQGKIFWVFHFGAQRMLNMTTGPSGACISRGMLGVVEMGDDTIEVHMDYAVDKSDHKGREELLGMMGDQFAYADREVLMALGCTQ